MNPNLVPTVDLKKIKTSRVRDYAIRFVFGATIALIAAVIGMALGPKFGGLFLGFPAILPASLTFIQKKEGSAEAAVDSAGAVLGAVAMVGFAVLVASMVTSLGVNWSVMLGLVVWLAVAVGLYFLVAIVYRREPTPP